MKGQIPDELVKEAKGGEVNVDMEDHRDEEFVKPKVSAKPFTGAGNVLGSIAPSVAAVSYSLMTTFPNKEITEDAATISGAGLVGAAVLQRLK